MSTTMKHLRDALGQADVPRPYIHPRRTGGSLYLDVVWEEPVEVRRAGAQLHILAAGLELASTGRWLIVVEPGLADLLVADVAGQLGLEVRGG